MVIEIPDDSPEIKIMTDQTSNIHSLSEDNGGKMCNKQTINMTSLSQDNFGQICSVWLWRLIVTRVL